MKEELDLRDFDVLGIIELDDIQGIEKYVTPIMKNGTKGTFLSRSKEYYNVKSMSELASCREELKIKLTQEINRRNFVILENMANCSGRVYFKMFERYILNKKAPVYREKMERARKCLLEDVKNIMTILQGEGKIEINPDKVLPYGDENSEQRAIEMDNKAMLYLFAKTLKLNKSPDEIEILTPGYGATYIGPMFNVMYGYDFTNTLKSKYIDSTIGLEKEYVPIRDLISSERILQDKKTILLIDDNVGTGTTIAELRETLRKSDVNRVITGAIQYNWRNYCRVSIGDKQGIERFEIDDFDILSPFNYAGHKLYKHAIAMLLSSGDEYIEYLHSKDYRRKDYCDLEGLVVRSLQYAQETGLTLIDKTVISDRKKVEEFNGSILQRYQGGPRKITNPISIKTMQDFIKSTEMIASDRGIPKSE